ncbi:nuclear poly(A) polymerase 3-like [Gossypium raimondii]|uniref:nuclear poly(A) polymerase 3-like n=1 Tax=Gossypium raimondii TaxID=29730 RepID=UPI00227D0F2F|nr:nuclear poly(A) polymerase 3-like [Gossypium raimondii]
MTIRDCPCLANALYPDPINPTKMSNYIFKDVVREIRPINTHPSFHFDCAWVKRVAWQRRLPKQDIAASSATLLTYGSYGLGVLGLESNIDALRVGPTHFDNCYVLIPESSYSRLRGREVGSGKTSTTSVLYVLILVLTDFNSSYVLIRESALLRLPEVHGSKYYIDALSDDFFIVLYNMLKSRPEVSEIHYVKDAKVLLMRFEFDGISINLPFVQLKVLVVLELNGFLGGIHLAILAAFVCQCDPYVGLSALISHFFITFAFWPWPRPVELQDGMLHSTLNPTETRLYIPIRLPFSPYEYCHSNITKSTFYKIRTEFLRGHNLTKDLLKFDFDWHNVLEPFPYTKKYVRFLKIFLLASNQDEFGDWVGWIKSCFRCLLIKLEEVQGLCDPNPVEYIDVNIVDPHVIFYWGLQAGKTNAIDIKSVKDVFWKNISTGYQGPFGK